MPRGPAGFDPGRYKEIPVAELLEAAALGWIGVDRRLVQAILDSSDNSAAEVARFARAPRDEHRLDIDPLLVDLLRHYRSPDVIELALGMIRRAPEDVPDELVLALIPFAEAVAGPLLDLYDELGEEQGSDIAFLLAGLQARDPRVADLLLERLIYDAADGAFCLGIYGDPVARPALEEMLAEVPEEDHELRREMLHALRLIATPDPPWEPEAFDILAEYPKREMPSFDLLSEGERLEMLQAAEADVRAGAAHSFFNSEPNAKAREALLEVARKDSDDAVRGRAWQALSDATEDAGIRAEMVAVLNDNTKPLIERGGAAVGLHLVADRPEIQRGIEELYELGGKARAKALEAMWRSLWEPYAKYFPASLDDTDPEILRQALRGAGYFRLTRHAGTIAKCFDRDEPFDTLREDALFAYAMAMPGETTRGRVKGMLRKLDALAGLSAYELELVEFGFDERLRIAGLDPVFAGEGDHDEPEPEPSPPATQKVGRNDTCPCGSGKKYKKCCGK